MFQIPVWDLLSSYTGDNQELAFDGPVYDGYYEDISFIDNLQLRIRLISIDEGIEIIISELRTKIKHEWVDYQVDFLAKEWAEPITRRFVTRYDPLAPDDIKMVDKKTSTVDLKDIIREEILLQVMQY
jgi:hypothetical protein